MKKTVLGLLLALVVQIAGAQITSMQPNESEKKEEQWKIDLKKNRFEAGADLLWLINGNFLPDYMLQFKIHTIKDQKRQGAWRFRVGTNTTLNDKIEHQSISAYSNVLNIITDVGYQWNLIKNKLLIFYGTDLHFAHKNLIYDRVQSESNSDILTNHQEKTTMFGIKSFLGMSYFISPHFSFSLDSHIVLRHINYFYFTNL